MEVQKAGCGPYGPASTDNRSQSRPNVQAPIAFPAHEGESSPWADEAVAVASVDTVHYRGQTEHALSRSAAAMPSHPQKVSKRRASPIDVLAYVSLLSR